MRYCEGYKKGSISTPSCSLTVSIDEMEKVEVSCYELESEKINATWKVLKIENLSIFATAEQLEQIRETIGAELERSKVAVGGGVTHE